MSTAINQLRMSMLDTNYHSIQNIKDENENCSIVSKEDEAYLKSASFKYDKSMDYNDDGTVSYDEYMRYCEENAVSQYNANPNLTTFQKITDASAQVQSIRPINIGKALNLYFHSESNMLETAVESQA